VTNQLDGLLKDFFALSSNIYAYIVLM